MTDRIINRLRESMDDLLDQGLEAEWSARYDAIQIVEYMSGNYSYVFLGSRIAERYGLTEEIV
jgi:hypothetical protein